MPNLSKRATRVSPSLTLAITAEANKLKKAGVDVVSFAAGEPDFVTPQYIMDGAKVAMEKGMTKYTLASGTVELRQEIAKKLLTDNGLHYTEQNIVVNNGAKHSLYNVLQTIADEGDEVIILAPFWLTYPELVKFCDATPVIVDLGTSDFRLDVEKIQKAITPKTKAIMLTSPNNPTGMIYDKQSLLALGKMLEQYPDIWVISDEIYEKLIYDGHQHFSFAAVPNMFDRTFVVNGFSKAYAMTGWRVGYVACPTVEVAKAMGGVQSHQASNVNSIAQYASMVALQGGAQFIADMQKTFDIRRKLMVSQLKDAKGVTVKEPMGAFYVMLDVSKTFDKSFNGEKIENALNLAKLILGQSKVATIPCEGFGAPNYLRLSYATNEEQITKGTARLKEFLAKLD